MQFPTCSATWQRPIVWRSLSDYRSLIASRSTDTLVSVTHQWSRRGRHCPPRRRAASGFNVGHDDAVDSGLCTIVGLCWAKLPSSTSPQKPSATYTRVNDFGPHTDSIFRGRRIRESDLYASIYGIRGADTPGPIPIKFGTRVAPRKVISMSNFCNKIFRGLRSTGGQNPCFPIDFAGRHYNSAALPRSLWCWSNSTQTEGSDNKTANMFKKLSF